MSADDLKRAMEEAEKAANGLKDELRRAKALVREARDRLGRQVEAAPSSPGLPDPVAGATPRTANDR